MTKILVVLSVVAFLALAEGAAKRDHNDYTKNPYRVVCYFGSWANYHKNETFKIEDINYDLCTHINYGFAKLDEYNWTIVPFDPYLDTAWESWDLKAYKRFNDLRKKNPNLTTMIALGGWYEGSEKYSDMAKDPVIRKRFVKSAVEFLQAYDFDGMDLDWEYPASRKGKPIDKDNFYTLLAELKEAFEPHGFLLTAALSPGKGKIDAGLGTAAEVKKLNDLLDWANVMTYDYHGGWEDFTGHNAPLYKRPDETDEISLYFNINYTIHYYIELGLKKEKIVMGVPFYGRAWTILSPEKVKLHDTVKGMSPAGFIGGEEGVLGYNELCMLERDHPAEWGSEWTESYDPYYKAPYAYNKKIWIGFDNEDSLICKVSFLKEMGLSGGMVWALENDDFKNRCGKGEYPLLHTVNKYLNGPQKGVKECKYADVTPAPTTQPTTAPTTPSTTTTAQPTTTERQTPPPTIVKHTEAPTTTAEPETASPVAVTIVNGHTIKCFRQGMFSHPTDRHKYIYCEYIAGGPQKGWWIHIMNCAPGTRWHQPSQNCIGDE